MNIKYLIKLPYVSVVLAAFLFIIYISHAWNALLYNVAQIKFNKAIISGDAEESNKLLREATGLYEYLRSIGPGKENVLTSLGQAYLLQGDPLSAQKTWSLITPGFSFDQSILLYRWIFHHGQSIGLEYQAIHQIALNLGLEFSESYVKLGREFWQVRELDSAELYLKKALEVASKYEPKFKENEVEAHYWLGRVYHRQGEIPSARAHYLSVTAIDPDNQWLWYSHPAHLFLGDFELNQGRCDQAAIFYQEAYRTASTAKQIEQAKDRCENLSQNEACKSNYFSPCIKQPIP